MEITKKSQNVSQAASLRVQLFAKMPMSMQFVDDVTPFLNFCEFSFHKRDTDLEASEKQN
jgi:hypothetical protein